MFKAVKNPFLVPYDGSFRVKEVSTEPPDRDRHKIRNKKRLRKLVGQLDQLQRVLYADDSFAVLLIFQALDAAGKDSTIRAVLRGVNPAGCQVFSFKQPTAEELDHDFLWRTHSHLPERGRIGVFNRSYYEEVLVVRVHPEFLDQQRLGIRPGRKRLWEERLESIRNHELHLARNGTIILKFWLNVSREEQRKRFLSRLEEKSKNWKFSESDVQERGFWDRYMKAYEEALRATSRPWAPWYAIPADDKPFMRTTVARIVAQSLRRLPLRFPDIGADKLAEFERIREHLESET
ncbi:MAG: polyphosphate kinase 2 family protein [Acidobacteriota bacterium]|jgi:PPK2 family polyphosphate:nucleotide phosphotransferase